MNFVRRIAFAVIGIAPLVALATAMPSAHASVLHRHVLSHCTASGDFATCVTGATTGGNPTNIHVHVFTRTPGQHVFVAWDMVCAKGSGAGTRSGSFNGITTVNRRLPQPYLYPNYCIVSADAQLSNPGEGRWIEVQITYWD